MTPPSKPAPALDPPPRDKAASDAAGAPCEPGDSAAAVRSSAQCEGDAALARHLSQLLAAGRIAELAAALGAIVRERGVAEVAREAGLSRESLYKALRGDASPRLDTINRVCRALGIQLVAEPLQAPERGPLDPL